MFLGESFSLFVYLYQKFILLKNEKKKQFKRKKTYNNIQKIILILFLTSICDLLGCDETIINIKTNNILNLIFFKYFYCFK
jgi:phage-related holin